MDNSQKIHIMEGEGCVYVLPYGGNPFPKSFKNTKPYPIRPYCKKVTIWTEPVDKPVNSLVGIICSTATLGVQFERLKEELSTFKVAPVVDDMFYFLLGTQKLTFYCENSEGKKYKVTTEFESIKSNEWQI